MFGLTLYRIEVCADLAQLNEQSSSDSAPPPALPPHREWPDIASLDVSEITNYLNCLNKRCATAWAAFDASLIDLETRMQLFLHTGTPTTSDEVTAYLSTFTATQTAGRNIFGPQEAYRNAIATLSLFVVELIHELPKQSEVRERVEVEFEVESMKMNEFEDAAALVLKGLVDGISRGGERTALMTYVRTVRTRFCCSREQEDKLKKWADQCVKAWL
jgi:hypothetical protein